MLIANTRTVLARCNECIYCGATENLSDEHIIPFGLFGNLVLERASCESCARITSLFERRVLRGFMRDARVTANYPTRHKKNKPRTLPLQRRSPDGVFETVELDQQLHPGFLHLPLLHQARAFGGSVPDRGVSLAGFETIYFGLDPTVVAKQLSTDSLQVSTDYDITAFARMLAKIAYGFAVGKSGKLSRDSVPILPLILGHADDGSQWIGSSEFALQVESERPLHALAITEVPSSDGERVGLVVRVKLFASCGATGYEVLVDVR